MGSTNFGGFRDQNSHRFRDQGSNFWVKIWDRLRKNIPRYDPDIGHSIYISVPWFRFTLMDLALRVLFHQFQIIFDRIRLTFSVAIGTKSTNAIE